MTHHTKNRSAHFCRANDRSPGQRALGRRPATMLKRYIYSYLDQMQSSRRLEREAVTASLAGTIGAAWALATRLMSAPLRIWLPLT
jgi:hypothetical protein